MIARKPGPFFFSRRLIGLLFLSTVHMASPVYAAPPAGGTWILEGDPLRQLDELLPTPGPYRAASGAPGAAYWQQKVDYTIDVTLDDQKQRIAGRARITYLNRSPDTLTYLWLQLEPNIYRPDSDAVLTMTAPDLTRMPFSAMRSLLARETFQGGVAITSVTDSTGKPLHHAVVKTMMRVDMPKPLATGQTFVFSVDWHYTINDCRLIRGRSGYEYFPEDKNYLYEIAQWFPRLAAYTDATGWQNEQFLGPAEFALEFGDYLVRITVPADHTVAATGRLINPEQVLTPIQRQRMKQAATAEQPVFIVTPQEAKANEKSRAKQTKTWIFHAERVRDFAFASSRKFIWNAQGTTIDQRHVTAMSYYPNEGEPLWSKYSTPAIVHTLKTYSHYTFPYPYPVACSVNGPVGGMEYPMICFNGPRPEKDGTYSKRTKYGLISVVIHEVGHNFFPMIVNSDERQWTWMDEGFNTFLQYLAEQQWEANYPSRRGVPQSVISYMTSDDQVPIMTSSKSLRQFHNNAYAKTAAGLTILRETILGHALFDRAFQEYARRWMFKHPRPADFFRTMEDATSIDLDWFFRGWFYSTEHVDLAITRVRRLVIDSRDPTQAARRHKAERAEQRDTPARRAFAKLPKLIDQHPELKDFYNTFDEFEVTAAQRAAYQRMLSRLTADEKRLLQSKRNFYVVDIDNVGGLVMPLLLRVDFQDKTTQELRIPVEIWRLNDKHVSKLIMTPKLIKSITLDPHQETADSDTANNRFPRSIDTARIELFKPKPDTKNPM